MIAEVTREEHYHALRSNADVIGYCLNLFYDKTKSKLPKQHVVSQLTVWLKLQGIKTKPPKIFGLVEGCAHIQKFFSKKFA